MLATKKGKLEHKEDELVCTLSALTTLASQSMWYVCSVIAVLRRNGLTLFGVNAFMWKVFWGAISMDRNIQQRGIPFAWRCVCCSSPNIKTMEHLFYPIRYSVWYLESLRVQASKGEALSLHWALMQTLAHGVHRRSQLSNTTVAILFFWFVENLKN